MSKKVYIEHGVSIYPTSKYGYAPSKKYPEYQWDDIASEENTVYDMVRNALHGYGLDAGRFDTPGWNPLKDIISEGDTVILKPNWVEDKNENRGGGTDCLVTHASIIRAMIDYVYLALGDSGKIIVGDSPMPDCDIKNLMKVMNYESIWDSCKKRGIEIYVMDFREDIISGFSEIRVEVHEKKEVDVDLGESSLFADTEQNIGRYFSLNPERTNGYYHIPGHHRYGINKTALSADVIINLPKPKTHRKAGYTAALKNFIGICSRKMSVPHFVNGSEDEGGDAYYGPKIIFGTEEKIRIAQNKCQTRGNRLMGLFLKCCRTPFWLFRRATHRRFFGTGNWYKNDTIWRSILDINRIMIYADKEGVLHDTPQRRFFSLGDMIISGDHNGPLAPSPIDVGVILCSEDPVAFDLAVINIMGLKKEMLPVLNNISTIKSYTIPNENSRDIVVYSNDEKLNNITLDKMSAGIYGFFTPAEGWDLISLKPTY